jgi:predicted Zn-dependent protease
MSPRGSAKLAPMDRPLLALALAGALALSPLGCITNPVTRGRDVVFVSPEEEVRLGAEAAEQVASEMGIAADPALAERVGEVGRRIAAAAPQQSFAYTFQVVDRAEPNAFALPGGYVYVSRGLLALTNNEDELANVIAHEVVHVAARHHARRQARATGVGLLALPGLLVGGLLGGPLGGLVSAPFQIAGAGAIASYSRAQELEADEYGQRIASQAGYRAAGLAEFLETLARDTELHEDGARRASWFDSHPATPRRASQAAERARGFGEATPAQGSADFVRKLEGLLVGDNPAEGVFDGGRFLHPDLGFTLVFPEGWKTANTRRVVGAFREDGTARVFLQHAGRGEDASEAASEFFAELSQEAGVEVARMEEVEVAGRKGVRAQVLVSSGGRPVALDLTWIPHGGSVYLLAGVVPRGYDDSHRSLFGEVGTSFARLRAAQRAVIRETRLRLRSIRPSETLAAFGERIGNAWSPEQTAVANGLPPGGAPRAGQVLKVAIEQPYRAR